MQPEHQEKDTTTSGGHENEGTTTGGGHKIEETTTSGDHDRERKMNYLVKEDNTAKEAEMKMSRGR